MDEIRKKLSPLQYHVTQEHGTERPFQNEYWDNKKEGIYVDLISGEVLFSSQDKYDSGTGWPSFSKPVSLKNIKEVADASHGMNQIEVRSQRGDCHLGHLFPDGPESTGLRYCINSAALRFIPKEEMAANGYADYLSLFSEK